MAGQRATSTLEVNDVQFMKRLELAFADLRIRSEDRLMRTAIEVSNWAKIYCPVATGNLRASINTTELLHDNAAKAYVIVGTGVEYAAFVEYGTYKMHAQPYFRPALGIAYKLFQADRLRDSSGRFLSAGDVAAA